MPYVSASINGGVHARINTLEYDENTLQIMTMTPKVIKMMIKVVRFHTPASIRVCIIPLI